LFKQRFDLLVQIFGNQKTLAEFLEEIDSSALTRIKQRDGRINSPTEFKFESKGINTGWLIKGKGTPWNETDAGRLIKEKIQNLGAKFWLQVKKLTVYEAPIDDRSFTLGDGDDGEIIPRKDPLGYHGKVLLPRIIEFLIRKHGSWKKASNKYKKNVEYPDNFIRDGRIDIHFLEELFEDGLDVNYLLKDRCMVLPNIELFRILPIWK
jgi:hypothetical protein